MLIMNMVEAKAKLSELVARAEAGEEVYIVGNGTVCVRVELLQSDEKLADTLTK